MIGRKHWLFAGANTGANTGAETLARAMTVVETAKLNGLDPQAYLADVLDRIHDHKINRLDELLPVELGTPERCPFRGRLMAAVTSVCTIDYVAKMMGEDVELLEAIISNDDNLTYGDIVSVYLGPHETISALTDAGIEKLTDMIRAARINTKTWHEFLDDFVDDAELVSRIRAQSPREQWSGY